MISIIMCVYNGEKYMRESIDSVLNQSFRDLELVLINDGSKDSSFSIMEEYAKKDDRVSLYSQTNRGLAYSRNLGVQLAKGEWITFADADDLLHKDMLSNLYQAMIEQHCQIAYGRMVLFGNQKVDVNQDIRGSLKILNTRDAIKRYYDSGMGNVQVTLFKKFLFKNCSFPNGMIYEDNIPKLLTFLKCKRIAEISNAVYYYRRNNSGITRSEIKPRNFDILTIASKQYCILKKEHLTLDHELMKSYFTLYSHVLQDIIQRMPTKFEYGSIRMEFTIEFYIKLILWRLTHDVSKKEINTYGNIFLKYIFQKRRIGKNASDMSK